MGGDHQKVRADAPCVPMVSGDFRIVYLIVKAESEEVDMVVVGGLDGDFAVCVKIVVGEPVRIGVPVQQFGSLLQIRSFNAGDE